MVQGQPLMEAGLDSLGTGELRMALNDAFGTDVPATFVLDYPTPVAMADAICQLVNVRAMAELHIEEALLPDLAAQRAASVGMSHNEVKEALEEVVRGILGNMGPDQVITPPCIYFELFGKTRS